MLERDIQSAVVAYARRIGIIAHKFSSEARRNVPDYLFLYEGRIYFIEFKATGAKPRDGQVKEIKKLRDGGFNVDVCDEKIHGKAMMQAFKDNALI